MVDVAIIEIQLSEVSAAALSAQASDSSGAEVIFNGYARSQGERDMLQALLIEHYPPMTEKALLAIAEQTCQRFGCESLSLLHRVGRIEVGELIVSLRVQARHRRAAFDAAECYMDYLKNSAPFWKKEISVAGDGHWVEQKQSDRDALQRWQGDADTAR